MGQDRLGQADNVLLVGGAEQLMDLSAVKRSPPKASSWSSSDWASRMRAAGPAGDQLQGLVVGLHAFVGDDLA